MTRHSLPACLQPSAVEGYASPESPEKDGRLTKGGISEGSSLGAVPGIFDTRIRFQGLPVGVRKGQSGGGAVRALKYAVGHAG
jgi:hypothetical protein